MRRPKWTILTVDDEEGINRCLGQLFCDEGYAIFSSTSGKSALRVFEEKQPDAVILDLLLPDMDGLELLRTFKKINSSVGVVILTGYARVENAVEAMKLGALDFITKPIDNRRLKDAILKILKSQEQLSAPNTHNLTIVGESPQLKKVWQLIHKVAPTNTIVLLVGETGTGKELFAQAIHQLSPRCSAPFVIIDCTILPHTLVESELYGHERGSYTDAIQQRVGKFERGDGGTVLLDEVSSLPLEMQAKLLRVLQEKEIERLGGRGPIKLDVRIIAATNSDLKQAVQEGRFREDLYYRLNEFAIEIPPLRDREGDVPLLAIHFLQENDHAKKEETVSVSPEAMKILEGYIWPGNVRELRHIVRSARLLSDNTILPEHLPHNILIYTSESGGAFASQDVFDLHLKMQLDLEKGLKDVINTVKEKSEKEILSHIMRKKMMDKKRIAQFLKIDTKTLSNKIKSYNL